MPWTTATPMTQRQQFIQAWLTERRTTRALCHDFGISEKTGYKWLARYQTGGPAALADQSRAPKQPPHQVDAAVRDAVLTLREQHPTWGARKLRAYLVHHRPGPVWPAPSTITELCHRAGLLVRRRPRPRATADWATPALTTAHAPNDVWATDFKGEFRLRSGTYCFPLTVSDLASRFLLACDALPGTAARPSQACFARLFATFGLPRVIRSDNGVPFAQPNALGALSRLAVWWIRLGIRPERTAKGTPQQNGAHERMHKTLKAEATRPPQASLPAQQRHFDRWRQEYNTDRPHEALGQSPPAAAYVPSDRRLPKRLPPLDYPCAADVRAVHHNGMVRVRSAAFHLSSVLAQEYVALEEQREAVWRVRFGPLQLGHWLPLDDTFHPEVSWLSELTSPP